MNRQQKQINQAAPKRNPKKPRSEQYSGTYLCPLWAFQWLDIGSPWCWSQLGTAEKVIEILQKMGNFEKMTWVDLGSDGCHSIPIGDLAISARKRLIEIKLDDIDELFSFRVTGKGRIWGIRDRNVVKVLWWDPHHSVCSSVKKHT